MLWSTVRAHLRRPVPDLRGDKEDWRQHYGDALIAAMKRMLWESPRGSISIDPETREMVQDIFTMSSSRNPQPLRSRPKRNRRDGTLSTVLFRFAKQGMLK
jgi:hypothetical protein